MSLKLSFDRRVLSAIAAVVILAGSYVGFSMYKMRTYENSTHEALRLIAAGKFADAAEPARKAYELSKLLFSPQDARFASTLDIVGQVRLEQGKRDEAAKFFNQAFEIRKGRLAATDPDLGVSYYELGMMKKQDGQNAEAQTLLTSAYDILEPQPLARAQIFAKTLIALGSVLHATGDTATGLSRLERGFEMAPQVMPASLTGTTDLKDAQLELALLYAASGKPEAEASMLKALSQIDPAGTSEEPRIAEVLFALGKLQRTGGKFADAETSLKRASAVFIKLGGEEDPRAAEITHELGRIALATEKYTEAETLFAKTVEHQEKTSGGAEYSEQGIALAELAQARLKLGKVGDATPLFTHAMELFDKDSEKFAAERLSTRRALAEISITQSKPSDAEKFLKEILEEEEKTAGVNNAKLIPTLDPLAQAISAQGRHAEAIIVLKRAVEIASADTTATDAAKITDGLKSKLASEEALSQVKPKVAKVTKKSKSKFAARAKSKGRVKARARVRTKGSRRVKSKTRVSLKVKRKKRAVSG